MTREGDYLRVDVAPCPAKQIRCFASYNAVFIYDHTQDLCFLVGPAHMSVGSFRQRRLQVFSICCFLYFPTLLRDLDTAYYDGDIGTTHRND